jgi:peptide/nickel transport system substrate-binding protein
MDQADPAPRGTAAAQRSSRLRWCGVVAAAIAVTALAAGCGGKASQGGPTGGTPGAATGSSASATGAPVTGGTLVVGEQQAPPTLNPGTLDLGFVDFTMLAYEPLFYLAPDGTVQPGLASSWHYVGAGNKELAVTLRSGATFSDGSAVTAAAVKASLDYAKGAQGDQAHYLSDVTVTVTGPLTLNVAVSTPNPILPYLLTQAYGVGQIIGPKGLASPSGLTPNGTSDGAGPYTYDAAASVAGDHYTYVANPNFFDKSFQHFSKITIQIFSSEQAAVNAAETGQVDIFKGDYTSAAQAKAAGLQIIANPAIMEGLYLIDRDGTVAKPLGDLRVRQAINDAIDRAAVTKALLGSYGATTDETVVPGADGYAPEMANYYPYDPAKAKQLLAAAGYRGGFTMNVLTAPFAGFSTMAQAISGQLAKVGIKLNLTSVSNITTLVNDETNHSFPATSIGFQEEPMYLEGLDLFVPGSKVFNGFSSSSDQLNSMWTQAAAASDSDRTQLDQQIETYLVKNAWFAPVSFTPVAYYARAGYGGVQTSAGAPFASPLAWYATK